MELKEFQGLALRTESHIESIKLDRDNIVTLFTALIELTEVLDAVKKAVFYNKTTKLEEVFDMNLRNAAALINQLVRQGEEKGAVPAIIGDNVITDIDPRVFHGILGIVTESGELAEALAKSLEDSVNNPIDAVNIQEEMSDIAWYKAILHDTLNLDWNQGLVNVINKLRVRYPEKYSDAAAENRNLFAERVELERGVNVSDMNANEMNVVHDFNHEAASQSGRFFGDLPAEQAILDKYNSLPTVTPGFSTIDGRRVFYVNIPNDSDKEQIEAILKELKNRVHFADGNKAK